MKGFVISIAFVFTTFALAAQNSMPMPPMPPGMIKPSKDQITARQRHDVCAEVPPMIIYLPPPLAKARAECLLKKQKPSKEDAKRRFSERLKSDVDIIAIKGVEGFENLYRFDIAIGKMRTTLFCDAQLRQCIQGEKVW